MPTIRLPIKDITFNGMAVSPAIATKTDLINGLNSTVPQGSNVVCFAGVAISSSEPLTETAALLLDVSVIPDNATINSLTFRIQMVGPYSNSNSGTLQNFYNSAFRTIFNYSVYNLTYTDTYVSVLATSTNLITGVNWTKTNLASEWLLTNVFYYNLTSYVGPIEIMVNYTTPSSLTEVGVLRVMKKGVKYGIPYYLASDSGWSTPPRLRIKTKNGICGFKTQTATGSTNEILRIKTKNGIEAVVGTAI